VAAHNKTQNTLTRSRRLQSYCTTVHDTTLSITQPFFYFLQILSMSNSHNKGKNGRVSRTESRGGTFQPNRNRQQPPEEAINNQQPMQQENFFGSMGPGTMMDMMYNDHDYRNTRNEDPNVNSLRSGTSGTYRDSLRSQTNMSSVDIEDSLFSREGYQLLLLCASAGTATIEEKSTAASNINNNDSEVLRCEEEESWEHVRDWLRNHNEEEIRRAVEIRDDQNRTALHLACRNRPPIDIIIAMVSMDDNDNSSSNDPTNTVIALQDSFGWLPLHNASAHLAHQDVIKLLTDKYPQGKKTIDNRGRTPLHLVSGNGARISKMSATHAVVAILSSSGAASCPDFNGMLPLHYACAYGASEEALYVLTASHQEGIRARDRNGRTPLHFALSNAGNEASPTAVKHLLELDPDLANRQEGGSLPLRVLADFANRSKTFQRDSVLKCLRHLLNANPHPTPDFFTALQSLPVWLSDHAVVMPKVQMLLNDKISQRFPTSILMADLIILILTFLFYFLEVRESLEKRFSDQDEDARKQPEMNIPLQNLMILIICIAYFLLREIVQMISFISMNSFSIWLFDLTSWLNVLFVALMCYWTIIMGTGGLSDTCEEKEFFREGTALTVIFIWLKIAIYLRQTFQTFAVFLGAMIYILRRLTFFVISMAIFLIAFTQLFSTEKMFTKEYNEVCKLQATNATKCGEIDSIQGKIDDFHYCTFWRAFLHMLTMLLGEVDDTEFWPEPFILIFFLLFMIFMVVILATVLIAVVTDSYKIIQMQRSAIVFWKNRLHFVAQVDAISSGFQNENLQKGFCCKRDHYNKGLNAGVGSGATFGNDFWKQVMDLFEDEVDTGFMSPDFWIYNFMRLITAVFIIPAWFLLGLLSLGWLWPPQLRQFFWTAPVTKNTEATEEQLRKTQVESLDERVNSLKNEITHELAIDRIEIVQMKSSLADKQSEIANEMRQIKRIMTELFDQQAENATTTNRRI